MNIYKISQKENTDYDTYDSAVVIAENEDEARKIHPSKSLNSIYTWTKPKNVKVELIGNTHIEKKCVICSSFNRG